MSVPLLETGGALAGATWGHPWHGLVRSTSGMGTLTRDIDGGMMAYRQPSNGHTVIYAPGRPAVTPTEAELTDGFELRNYAIISGDQLYGKPVSHLLRWITHDDLGRPWGVRIAGADTSTPLAGGTVELEFNSLMLGGEPIYPQTLVVPVASWGQDSATYWLTRPDTGAGLGAQFADASRDGRSMLLMLYNLPPLSVAGGLNLLPSNGVAETGHTGFRYPCGWVRINLAASGGIFSAAASVAIPRSTALGGLNFGHSQSAPLVGVCHDNDADGYATVSGDLAASMSIGISGRVIAAWFDASGAIQTTMLDYSDERTSTSSRAPGAGDGSVGSFLVETRNQIVSRSISSSGATITASYELKDTETRTAVSATEGLSSGEYMITSPVGSVSGAYLMSTDVPDFLGLIYFGWSSCPGDPPQVPATDYSGFFGDERNAEAWRLFFCISSGAEIRYNAPTGLIARFGVCLYTPNVFGFYSQQILYRPPNRGPIPGGSIRHYHAAIGRGFCESGSMVNNSTATCHASDHPVTGQIAMSFVPNQRVAFV